MHHDNPRSRQWFKLAALYFAVGVTLGVVMGASGDHTLRPVHAHINLLGWVSMALFGLVGMAYPAIHEGRVATVQFWSYNLGLPLLLAALALMLKGVAAAGPVVGIASVVVGASVLLFAWQAFARIGPGQAREPAPR
jgi:cbb3-type cytochrome oxidase subunit 1